MLHAITSLLRIERFDFVLTSSSLLSNLDNDPLSVMDTQSNQSVSRSRKEKERGREAKQTKERRDDKRVGNEKIASETICNVFVAEN